MSPNDDSADEWWDTAPYPGLSARLSRGPQDVEMPGQLSGADRGRLWRRDFHYPCGLLPLSMALLGDLSTGAQTAAGELSASRSGGMVARLVGPHVYLGVRPAQRVATPARAGGDDVMRWDDFRTEWSAVADDLLGRFTRLDAVAVEHLTPNEMCDHLADARAVHADAWRIHFAFMYRLLLQHRHFADSCSSLGIAEDLVPVLLQGEPTSVSRVDSELRELACRARAAGLAEAFHSDAGTDILGRLGASAEGASWASRFFDLIHRVGQRSEVILDVGSPSWAEEPGLALKVIAGQLSHGAPAPRDSLARRQRVEAQIRRALDGQERARFDQLLGAARSANFVWWNEEHNTFIDLRAHLPLRRSALAIGRRGSSDPTDALYLSFEELEAVARGDTALTDMSELITARREYHQAWVTRRTEIPSTLGVGAVTEDLILVEILGAGQRVRPHDAGLGTRFLSGLGVSAGTARGPVRVVRGPDDLRGVRRGEVLVCQATSPSWTTVFSRLAACVCEDGGMLTHAAIISREYGLPCVCSADDATRLLADGDLVEVNGTEGTVKVLRASSG